MDTFSTEKRSEIMAKIRSSGNLSTELRLRLLFKTERITGWRRNSRLIGRPDFIFRCEKIAVFVDGCFWHGCSKCFIAPKSNQRYWEPKIQRNRLRDRFVVRELKKKGWRVLRIWEHEFKFPSRIVTKIRRHLCSSVSQD